MRRCLPFLAAVFAIAAVPSGAAAHEKAAASAAAAFSQFFDDTATAGLLNAELLADAQPLTGTGSNMRIVANIPMEGSVAASDLELAGDYAYVGSYGEGMVIVDITDPRAPKRAGVFNCPGGQNDIQLQPGSNPQYAILAIESTSNKCHPNNEGFVVIDISDKAKPREVAFVGQGAQEGGVEDGAHNTTLDWPHLYVDQYQPTHRERGAVDIFDIRKLIANPNDRTPIAVLDAPGGGAHDIQVDHRPDGKAIAYGASIGFTDVMDVTDPTKPKFLQRLSAGEHGVGISHGAEPNFDRTLMIETDEYGGGSGVGACGGGSDARVPPNVAGQLNGGSPGAVHLLRLDKDGKIKTLDPAGTKVDQIGAYNIPAQANDNTDAGCTSHVFWQAPNENRMVIAWYGRGTRVFDFSNPDAPVEVGHFIPTGAETWSAKPHKGYIFAGDTIRGLDVLEYTGEKCSRWPTIAGAAEVQRARYQGTSAPADAPAFVSAGCDGPATNDPARPLKVGTNAGPTLVDGVPGSGTNNGSEGAPGKNGQARGAGGYRFIRSARVPRSGSKFRTLKLQIFSAKGKKVIASRRFRARTGRKVVLRAAVGGPAGKYRYRIAAGRRTLRAGAFTIKTTSKVRVAGATAKRVRIGALGR